MPYLNFAYLESWFSWFRGGMQKTMKKKKKTDRIKHSKMKKTKNEEYRESQMTTIYISGFTFYIKNHILLENII